MDWGFAVHSFTFKPVPADIAVSAQGAGNDIVKIMSFDNTKKTVLKFGAVFCNQLNRSQLRQRFARHGRTTLTFP